MSYLSLSVLSPSKDLFAGMATAVSSVNSSGPFDILPAHANMITFIQEQPIKVALPDGKSLEFRFREALIYCRQNTVTVFTGFEEADTLLPSLGSSPASV